MQKVISSDSRSIQIDKLLPFSSYTFYLRLYMDSASEFSEKAICQTGEEGILNSNILKRVINGVYILRAIAHMQLCIFITIFNFSAD